MFENPHETLCAQLLSLLTGECWLQDTDLINCEVSTFKQAEILTFDEGLVIRTPDGREYHLTIVRSR